MNSQKDENEKLRRILRQAHQGKENIEVDLCPEDLMRRIREAGPVQAMPSFFDVFGPLVWRLAPVVCLLILVLIGVLSTLNFSAGDDLLQMFMNGKEEITLAQLFEF